MLSVAAQIIIGINVSLFVAAVALVCIRRDQLARRRAGSLAPTMAI